MTNKTTKDRAPEQTVASATDKLTEPKRSLKSLLAAAPLDGVDIDRLVEKQRTITFVEIDE